MNNPPLTFIINVMNITTAVAGGSLKMMLPANMGALLTGSVIAYIYPNKIAEKYTRGDEKTLQRADILVHWLPTMLLTFMYRRKVRNRHVLMGLLLPPIYFSLKQNNDRIYFTNPIKHLQETYPGVPLWVFSLYAAGALSLGKYTRKPDYSWPDSASSGGKP